MRRRIRIAIFYLNTQKCTDSKTIKHNCLTNVSPLFIVCTFFFNFSYFLFVLFCFILKHHRTSSEHANSYVGLMWRVYTFRLFGLPKSVDNDTPLFCGKVFLPFLLRSISTHPAAGDLYCLFCQFLLGCM